MTTACIQIGNSDDKLTQREWADFCKKLRVVCELHGEVHFAAPAPGDAPWQNYCIVVAGENAEIAQLKNEVRTLRGAFKQESAAWVEGVSDFV